MGDNGQRSKLSRFLLIGILVLAFLGGLEYYLHTVQGVGRVYSHAAYIPIVIAAFWWGLKGGLLVSSFLGLMHVIFYLPSEIEIALPTALMFVLVGSVAGIIVNRGRRTEEELREYREHLEESVKERTSELEEKTIELEQANIRLQEVDRLKSVFLASMSHELRTPLNSIIGFTGILLQGISGALSDEQKKQLAMVKGSGQHLLDLINDLLDVSKIEAGKVEVSVEEFALADVANEVTEAISPAANKKKLDVVTELQDEIVLLSDRRRIKQVLVNLVSNAVKFTDQGQVTITGKRLDNKQVEVGVSDTGIGMKEEDIQRLFQPFQQIDESLTKEHEGTGLGLYLCRKIVDLLHGEISAQSEYGTGSTFTITLPLQHESETRRMSEEDSSD